VRTDFRFSAVVALTLAIATLGGCSTPTKGTEIPYSYEPRVRFPELKTYRWVSARQPYRQGPLLEANVRFLADRDLEAKGLTSKAEKAALLIWMVYEFDSYSYGFDLRTLTLNISRADNSELVCAGWPRGVSRPTPPPTS
jgi:hypothetical protein